MSRWSPTRIWRLLATALAFVIFGLAGALLPLIAAPVILLIHREPEKRQTCARWLVHKVFRIYLYILRGLGVLTWCAHDLERLRASSTLVLANHPTLLDAVFLVAHIPHANCLVKGELRRNFAMRGFIRLTGYLANEDGPALLEQARESIRNGASLVIFPEGTRTSPGAAVQLKRGAANIALRTKAPIMPVILKCEPIVLSRMHRWYHVPERRVHFDLWALPALETEHYRDLPRTIAARRLTQALETLFNTELTARGVGKAATPAPAASGRTRPGPDDSQ